MKVRIEQILQEKLFEAPAEVVSPVEWRTAFNLKSEIEVINILMKVKFEGGLFSFGKMWV